MKMINTMKFSEMLEEFLELRDSEKAPDDNTPIPDRRIRRDRMCALKDAMDEAFEELQAELPRNRER